MVSDEVVDRALDMLAKGGGNYEYFFAKLTSPEWIEPLKKRGRFAHPPPAVVDKSSIRFPRWPEGEYLVRMAPLAPERVAGAIDPISYQSDNHYVHQTLLEIAAELPVHLTAEMALAESRWASAQKRFLGLYETKVVPVLLKLAAARRSDVALMLLKALLQVQAAPERDPILTAEETPLRVGGTPVARIDAWNVQRLLSQVSKPLAEAAPEALLALLSNQLNTAVTIHVNERGSGNDFSLIWRPRIDSDHHRDLMDVFISAVRDVSVQVIESGGYEIVTRVFEEYQWPIFERLEYYALSRATENLPLNFLDEIVSQDHLYEDQSANPEFNEFLSQVAARLPAKAQEKLLARVDAGPDLSKYSKFLSSQGDKREETEKWMVDQWRVGWLTSIKSIAGDMRLKQLDELVAKYGQPRPAFSVGSAQYIGHQSAINLEELKKFSIPELVAYLKDWAPGPRAHLEMPSRAGIGRELQSWVSDDPALFSENLESFQHSELHPTYLRSILDAFVEALKNNRSFDPYKVVATIRWVLTNTETIGAEHFEWEEDPGWSWAHMSSARFLSELFLHPEKLDTSRHMEFWPALKLIASNPSPRDDDETEYRKDAHVGMLALNSTRPVGLEAVMRYARWLKLSAKEICVDSQNLPEVFDLLSAHLNPKLDNSVAVREMFGMQFGLLAWLDKVWWEKQLPALFPAGKALRHLDRFAWNSYLRFSRPYKDVLPAMRFRYGRAISGLQSNATEVSDEMRSLGNHLMQYYAAGAIELDDSLLTSFFEKASPALKAQTIGDIGWQLGQEDHPALDPKMQERLMALWEYRLARGLADVKSSGKELSSFGWWFGSKKFPNDWSMQQLMIVLEKFRSINPDFLVIKRVGELSPAYPYEAVRTLGILFEEDRDGWAIHGWEGNPQKIVREALNSNEQTRAEAERVVNLLVARGQRGFRDLK